MTTALCILAKVPRILLIIEDDKSNKIIIKKLIEPNLSTQSTVLLTNASLLSFVMGKVSNSGWSKGEGKDH